MICTINDNFMKHILYVVEMSQIILLLGSE